MREGKVRTIYDNYNLDEGYEETKQFLKDENGVDPSDEDVWNQIYFEDEINWEESKAEMEKFFDGSAWLCFGVCERWMGKEKGGFIFHSIDKLIQKVGKDCGYFHFYDVDGHFYMKCSHHDGTNLVEVKKITGKGEQYYENWEYDWDDKRGEEYVHGMIVKRYSVLPRFAEKVYGCPKREAA